MLPSSSTDTANAAAVPPPAPLLAEHRIGNEQDENSHQNTNNSSASSSSSSSASPSSSWWWSRLWRRSPPDHVRVVNNDDDVEAAVAPVAAVLPPPAAVAPSPGAFALPPRPMTAQEHVNRVLVVLSVLCKLMMLLTFLQIMCALQVEQVHFLTLYSIFVPWSGFEGVRDRNFAYLRLFYWGCLIMIPTNVVHYYSFDDYVDQILNNKNATMSDALKDELRFNRAAFCVVTVLLVLVMSVSLALVSRLGRFRALLQPGGGDGQATRRVAAAAAAAGGAAGAASSGLLTSAEIAALPRCAVTGKEEDELCVICQDEFQLGDADCKRLHCRHLFHSRCIDTWLERSSLCPICNGDVRSIV